MCHMYVLYYSDHSVIISALVVHFVPQLNHHTNIKYKIYYTCGSALEREIFNSFMRVYLIACILISYLIHH